MSEALNILGRANIALALAIVLVLVLRRPARRLFGAKLAYGLWLTAPLVVLASLAPALPAAAPHLPGLEKAAGIAAQPLSTMVSWAGGEADGLGGEASLIFLWLVGVVIGLSLVTRSQFRFLRLAAKGAAGPAVIGVLFPRLIVPSDFEQRFEADERAVILDHERTHLARGDAFAAGVLVLVQCLCWFNPLVHLAAHCLRLDQEMACDADVVSRSPARRRTYAQAMLKTQLAATPLPLGCQWPTRSLHPLEERIAMLNTLLPGKTRRIVGASLAALLITGAGYATWAANPGAGPVAVAAQSLAAPTGLSGLTMRLVDDSDQKTVQPGNERMTSPAGEVWLRPGVEVTAGMVAKAKAVTEGGYPAIAFSLTPAGADRFAALTRANIGRRIAVLIDGQVVAAPVVMGEITGGSGVITGEMTPEQAADLAKSMTAAAAAAR